MKIQLASSLNMPRTTKIIQISDCHLFADKQKLGFANRCPFATLSRVLNAIKAENPDLVINTGDVSSDFSEESYLNYRQAWSEVGLSTSELSVAGNHDKIRFWEVCFNRKQGYAQHSLLNGTWHIHLLASRFKGALGTVTEGSLRAFADHVRSAPELNHIAVLHHSVMSSNVWMDKHYLTNANAVIASISSLPVRAVLHGHVHTERCVMLGNTPLFACPSTCWQWGNTKEFSVSNHAPGYRVIKLIDDGGFETSVKYVTEGITRHD